MTRDPTPARCPLGAVARAGAALALVVPAVAAALAVTLVWDNGVGLIFRQTIAVDPNYMLTVTQSVENATGEEVRLAPYGIIAQPIQTAILRICDSPNAFIFQNS